METKYRDDDALRLGSNVSTPKERIALAKALARNPYAWPGGYDIFAITTDGGVLCSKCCRSEIREIVSSCQSEIDDGWRIAGFGTSDWVSESMLCDHCATELCPYLDD